MRCGGELLRTDDLEKALREYGVPLHKPPYYADSYVSRRLSCLLPCRVSVYVGALPPVYVVISPSPEAPPERLASDEALP